MNFSTFVAIALTVGGSTAAIADWSQIQNEAKGQTVYFNAWGGSEATNAYIAWAAQQAKIRYCIDVRHVKVTDTAEVSKRVQTEVSAGRTRDGSIDLMWLNGENFRHLKSGGLLFGPWAQGLPNWALVDLNKPVRTDFSVPTEGFESPWGTAQLTFIADRARTPRPPRSAAELLAFAKANPGRVSYPKPPDFHGVTFVKQLLLELSADPAALQQPVTPAAFASATQALWAYLDQFHPVLWRRGQTFPASAAEMYRMLGDGVLDIAMTFNPSEAAHLITNQQLPASAYSFGFTGGTIGNVHFLAIPINARARAGAQVFANFLLSAEAQTRKADITVWGDGTVLDLAKLSPAAQSLIRKTAPGALVEVVPTLPEPHASWVKALEAEWLTRYGSR